MALVFFWLVGDGVVVGVRVEVELGFYSPLKRIFHVQRCGCLPITYHGLSFS